MLEMTQAEYARHRGVSRQAIAKLVKAGRIPLSEGRKIDAAAADRVLGETRERVFVRNEDDAPVQPRSGVAPVEGAGGGLTKAKTATEVYRARLAQLEYEERVGKVLKTDDVKRSMELCAELIVRDIHRLPARAEDFAAALSQGGLPALRALLKEESRRICATLEANMRVAAQGEADQATEEFVS